MESLICSYVELDRTKFPGGPPKTFSYGTAGFRDKADLLDCVLFRSAAIATLRSKCARGAIGVVITASHNPKQDNGVKFVDIQGQMLIPDWENVASDIANAKSEELKDVIMSVITKYDLDDNGYSPIVQIARDTRPSSDTLLSQVVEGFNVLGTNYTDHGLLTTPQLHYIVKSYNSSGQYGEPTLTGYYQKLSKAFRALMPETSQKPVMKLDAANGVGADRVRDLLSYIGDIMTIEVYNDGTSGDLNYMCGADYVKTSQVAPNGIPMSPGDCCVSFDGDADRIVFFYCSRDGDFVLVDGDKIASLMAMFITDMLKELDVHLNMSVVQTAYSNGNSTRYIENTLNIPVSCVQTGVKYLQRKAHEFDIGIFFEANGHGTALYSQRAIDSIRQAMDSDRLTHAARECGRALMNLIDLTNQTTGDSISDMLIVQAILSHRQMSCEEWGKLYTELPNEQMKVKVKDRHVVTTTDAERQCVTPSGLQDSINQLVSSTSRGRSFVRPSGTEDVVRVYAEAETKELAHRLAVGVAKRVYQLADGIGEMPSL